MRLRHAADFRTLIWSFVLFPLVPLLAYTKPELAAWLLPLTLYLAYCAGVLSHYHNHCPVFISKRANRLYSGWLSIFYGAPLFTWIPTHNRNHHQHVNGPGDAARTTRHTQKNALLAALTYPFASALWQLPAIVRYVSVARRSRGKLSSIALESAALVGGHTGLFAVAIALHGYRVGALTYLLAVGAPALFAPWAMMFTNYIQHVDCDPHSTDNHSRNFVGRLSNWFVFDAGYHTVHHEFPGTHWSHYRRLHEKRALRIAPALKQHSIASFLFETYMLGAVAPRFGTSSRARKPVSSPSTCAIASIEARSQRT